MGTGWTISGGIVTVTSAVGTPYIQQIINIEDKKFYKITLTISDSPTFFNLIIRLGGYLNAVTLSADGTYELIIRATGANGWLQLIATNTSTFSVDNVSVKEIAGYHAYQETSTARPTLQGSAGDYYLDSDLVDDRLLVDLPAISGTAVIASEEGTAAYMV